MCKMGLPIFNGFLYFQEEEYFDLDCLFLKIFADISGMKRVTDDPEFGWSATQKSGPEDP